MTSPNKGAFTPRELDQNLIDSIIAQEQALPGIDSYDLTEVSSLIGTRSGAEMKRKCLKTSWCCDFFLNRGSRLRYAQELKLAKLLEADELGIPRDQVKPANLPFEYLFASVECGFMDADVVKAAKTRANIDRYIEKIEREGADILKLYNETDGNYGFPEFEYAFSVLSLFQSYFSLKYSPQFDTTAYGNAHTFWVLNIRPSDIGPRDFQRLLWEKCSSAFLN